MYWEVQLERMESTNLLKLLEAEPEYQDLLQELGLGESQQASGLANQGVQESHSLLPVPFLAFRS